MTYGDPFTHDSRVSTPDQIITNPNAVYTVVTEAEDYLGGNDIDPNERYDTIQHLSADEVVAYANSLVDDDREVAIFQGRLSIPVNISRHIPVGYVYPGNVWHTTAL